MKKAEMQRDHATYHELLSHARSADRDGDFMAVVAHATSCLPHIDGMMRYSQKYEDREFKSVEAAKFICKYAPLVFDVHALDALEDCFKQRKRIEKQTSASLATLVEEAIQRLYDNHRLWRFLEEREDVRQDSLQSELGGDQTYWRTAVETWERAGVIRRMPEGQSYRLSLATQLDRFAAAKCSACGDVAEGPKTMFLQKVTCMACEKEVHFVLLDDSWRNSAEA